MTNLQPSIPDPQSPAPNPQRVELPLGDVPPKALRRELLTLTIPPNTVNQRVTIQVALEATVAGVTVTLPIDETSLRVLPPVEVEAAQFGGEPSILVRLRNNTGDALKATVSVASPLEFVSREVTLKARMVTEVRLVPVRPPLQMQLSSAQVQVTLDAGQKVQGKFTRWVSLIALPPEGNLLRNGSFEDGDRPPLPSWDFYDTGYKTSSEAVHGKRSLFCESGDTQTMRGAVQRVVLKQSQPVPLILHGFSKGESVFPSGLTGDYSLYLDARYVDGTPLWGEIVPFAGTGMWEWGWRLIVPEKPIQEALVYTLFRYRQGAAWFDGVGLNELQLSPNLAKDATAQAPENARALTDGDWHSVWQGSGETSITIDLPQAQKVQQVALWWTERAKAEQVRVEVWDGSEWRKVAERPTDNDTFVTVLDFTPTTTQRLRIVLTGTRYAVRELEVR